MMHLAILIFVTDAKKFAFINLHRSPCSILANNDAYQRINSWKFPAFGINGGKTGLDTLNGFHVFAISFSIVKQTHGIFTCRLPDPTDTSTKIKKSFFTTEMDEGTSNFVAVPGLSIFVQDLDGVSVFLFWACRSLYDADKDTSFGTTFNFSCEKCSRNLQFASSTTCYASLLHFSQSPPTVMRLLITQNNVTRNLESMLLLFVIRVPRSFVLFVPIKKLYASWARIW